MKDFSYVMNSDPSYVDGLYQDYQKDSTTIDPEWKIFFEGFDFATSKVNGNGAAKATGTSISDEQLKKEFAVFQLIKVSNAAIVVSPPSRLKRF